MSKQIIIALLIINAALLVFVVKGIFKNDDTFLKSLKDHFYPWDFMQNKKLDEWASKNDAHHKINILYAAVLMLVAINWLIYELWFA